MDNDDHLSGFPPEDISWMTILVAFAATALCLFTVLVSFAEVAQIGPDVGEIVAFDPANGPRYWTQPGIPATVVAGRPQRICTLQPSVMAASGGSLVIEVKETTRPPMYQVHWSGPRTDLGRGDCGRSADLILSLAGLRALATVAGGLGIEHKHDPF
jgi:hypothetical protein